MLSYPSSAVTPVYSPKRPGRRKRSSTSSCDSLYGSGERIVSDAGSLADALDVRRSDGRRATQPVTQLSDLRICTNTVAFARCAHTVSTSNNAVLGTFKLSMPGSVTVNANGQFALISQNGNSGFQNVDPRALPSSSRRYRGIGRNAKAVVAGRVRPKRGVGGACGSVERRAQPVCVLRYGRIAVQRVRDGIVQQRAVV